MRADEERPVETVVGAARRAGRIEAAGRDNVAAELHRIPAQGAHFVKRARVDIVEQSEFI